MTKLKMKGIPKMKSKKLIAFVVFLATISTGRATAITANAARELTNSDLVHVARIVAELDKATHNDIDTYDRNSDGVITNYDLLSCARQFVGLE
jgi:hypothetical protein